MSERFNATDVALARRLRALEDANDAAIRASAELVTTMVDAIRARRLPACAGQQIMVQLGGLVNEAISLQGKSVCAHQDVATLGTTLGLPVTAWGDCYMGSEQQPTTAKLSLVGQAA